MPWDLPAFVLKSFAWQDQPRFPVELHNNSIQVKIHNNLIIIRV